MPDDLAQVVAVVLSRSLEILRAEPPIHAPTPVAGPVLAEELLQSRPPIRRKWTNSELHVSRTE